MSAPIIRPTRTEAHAERDRLIRQFADVGLQPVISTNGSIPDADIQQAKAILRDGGKHGEVVECWLTERGQARLS